MALDLRALSSTQHLAKVCFTTVEALDAFLQTPKSFVRKLEIPRRDAQKPSRTAWQLNALELRNALKRFGIELDRFVRADALKGIYPHPSVHGYTKRRSAYTNALVHVGAMRLLKADVLEFFASITDKTIEDLLLQLGLAQQGAALVARFVTLDGSLPLGYPTSPLLSNLIFLELDEKLAALAMAHGAKYSRYADDLTFSGPASLPSRAEIQDILARRFLLLNDEKFKLKKQGQALYVTGYSVSDDRPHVPRGLKRRLRQQLYYVSKHGLGDHARRTGARSVSQEANRIHGLIQYVGLANPQLRRLLEIKWRSRSADKVDLVQARKRREREPCVLHFDDSEWGKAGSGIRAMGVSQLWDQANTTRLLRELITGFLLDPAMPDGAREAVQKRGLHFAELPEDFKRETVNLITRVPFRAHIAFAAAKGSKKEQTAGLAKYLLRRRLSECYGQVVSVVFEEGEYITKAQAPEVVEALICELPEEQRPLRVASVSVVSKSDDPCVALPDVVLGCWKNFALSRQPTARNRRERDVLLYQTLEPKIVTILNMGTGDLYSSKRPFGPFEAVAPGDDEAAGAS